jgi:hypothetical protein
MLVYTKIIFLILLSFLLSTSAITVFAQDTITQVQIEQIEVEQINNLNEAIETIKTLIEESPKGEHPINWVYWAVGLLGATGNILVWLGLSKFLSKKNNSV